MRLLLLFRTESQSAREMLEGISEYGHGPGQWEFLQGSGTADVLQSIDRFGEEADGILLHSGDPATWQRVASLGLPTVSVLNSHDGSLFPVVRDDEDALADLALGHLRELGLKRVGFLDYSPEPSFRAACLRRHAETLGMEWHHFGLPYRVASGPWGAAEQMIALWVMDLPKPTGIIAFAAENARNLASACRLAGIAVPDEIAILSVGDELACRLSIPPITGLDMNYRNLGWKAAHVLDRIMQGHEPKERVILNQPTGVIRRPSTDIFHTGNRWVAAAIRHIRDHLADGLKVGDIVSAAGTSRRVLEYAFLQHVGHSIHQEILRQQIAHARDLLSTSDMLMVDIAEACGLADRTRLCVLFRKKLGMTAHQYRMRSRDGRTVRSR